MPAKWLICPDHQQIEITECLQKCRLHDKLPAGRCLSIRTLRLVADQREWNGVPSTTMLLKGSRESYLALTTDFAIDPQDALFRVHGTKAHAKLDRYTGENELGELRLYDENSSGQFDFYCDGILFDNKTWGSFKIAKALGINIVTTEVFTGEYYKSGSKAGQPKYRKDKKIEKCEPDLFDEEMQLNDYRMKLEANGFPVKQIFVEALTRDGGTFIAQNRGIEQNGYLIPIRILPDDVVRSYFKRKHDELIHALETNTLPPKCSDRESWNGNKCRKYCNVKDECMRRFLTDEQERVHQEHSESLIAITS